MYKKFVKRFLDILLSGIAIVVLAPVYLVVYLLVKKKIGEPVYFEQNRVGYNNEIFVMRKFRSMTNETDSDGNLLPEAQRLIPFGAFIRSSCLDELPELISIFKGEMSIIGPRPLPDYYFPYYTEEELVRHTVVGGLLPPEVLLGKTSTEWDEQLQYDIYYAENCSFLLDLKILLKAVGIVFNRYKKQHGQTMRPHLNVERADRKRESEVHIS